MLSTNQTGSLIHVGGNDHELPNSGVVFSSKINICPGSSPTLLSSSLRDEEDFKDKQVEVSSLSSSEENDSLIDWGSDTSWPDVTSLPGTWGPHGLEEHPWNDDDKPCVRFQRYQDLKLTDTEYKGILTDRVIASSSSYLDRSPVTGKYVLCKVNLSKKLLTDISIITFHHYLQYVDLSWNELSTVNALGQLPFLMYLDVSHNFLTEVLDFKAPFNLTYVNYSSNLIKQINDLSKFWSIVHLDLSHNRIKTIKGVQELKYLRHLNLSYNLIECIENLSHMRLQTLNLMHNIVMKFEAGEDVGLKTLMDILHINVSYNRLKTLKLFRGIPGIQSITAVGNLIENLIEITYLKDLNFLSEVDFRENPMVTMKHYAETCISTIKYLYVLDGDSVDAEKKVLVRSNFELSPLAEAIKTSSSILFLQQINDPVFGQPIITSDHSPPPIIILVGPPGSEKAEFLQRFCKSNKRFTILGISHTTRNKTNEEIDKESYYFISGEEFREMAHRGEFLTVSHTFGQLFGLAQTEMIKTIGKYAVLMLHMDLTGALTLRSKGLRCKLILMMHSTAEAHRKRLFEKYYNRHEYYKYLGATEIENNPVKAKEFIGERNIQMKPTVTLVAKTIVNELLDTTVALDIEMDRMSEISETKSTKSNRTLSSTDSGKMFSSSSKTSGILKISSNRNTKTTDSQPPRVSVTFQEASKITTPTSSIQIDDRVQISRSVTFSEKLESNQSLNMATQSISGTVIRDEGLVVLSVLSSSQIHNDTDVSEDNGNEWNLQTEALKTAVHDIVTTRDVYLNTHHNNPGLFTDVIFTDKPEDAWKKLKHVLKESIRNQENSKPYRTFKKDSVYKVIVATRLKALHKEINSQLSITQKQITSMQKPSVSRPQMTLKNSEKEVVEKMQRKHQKSFSYRLPKPVNFTRRRSSIDSEELEVVHYDKSQLDYLQWVNP